MDSRLVLASASPRRRDLLAEAGYEFDAVSPFISELSTNALTLGEIALYNATRKALAVARRRPWDIVLAADTLVALDGKIIGKPASLDDAASILRRLSGRTHEVCSAVFICHFAQARSLAFREISRVRFQKLSERRIRDYLAKVNPLDKAGAYAAQGDGAEIIARIDGSYTNVVGLPMEGTIHALRIFGLTPEVVREPLPLRVLAASAPDVFRGAIRDRGTKQ